ncbi:protein MODIFYING WALL LIGNIN-1-like [Vigna umbellata]|uniref:protein MODIFYING WALL LIGNIN-1-like n=1 Tax=Vigna umbellata TaxID=87088 RepID=UPI001F5F24E5|nr:protein MODIFYING WALL LIGNIN-1-like [Vigna umbellata]
MLHLLKTLKHLIHCVFSCHINNPLTMENPPRVKFTPNFFIIISLSLGLFSFIFCVAAEIKRNKEDDLRWTGKLCSLPSSKAFGLGIAALVSFFLAQIIANSILLKYCCWRRKRESHHKMPVFAKVLVFISWVSFGFAGILLMVATSMNRRQAYRVGWLNGECYVVKGGTYAGSAMLVLFTVCSVNGSVFCTLKSSQPNQPTKVHKPMG